VVAERNHARETTLESLLDRWLERRRVESRGRSLNAAVKVKANTYHVCTRRQICAGEVAAKVGTRRPDQQAAAVWFGGKEGEVEDTRGSDD
jgi:hypothetical protein